MAVAATWADAALQEKGGTSMYLPEAFTEDDSTRREALVRERLKREGPNLSAAFNARWKEYSKPGALAQG